MPEIKNLKKAANRIKKAIRKGERIILYGDSDLDGVCSVVILQEAIQGLGGKIHTVFFPDRENDGYGITERALNYLKNAAPALFISLDLGIGNFSEVKLAKQMGFEIIIIDHHQILGHLPEALIIVDPQQKGDRYPFKGLATAGIVFKLSFFLLNKKISNNLKNSFVELAALATLADLMPVTDENKNFIREGIKSLSQTFRPGLRVFLKIFGVNAFSGPNLQKIISILNSGEMIGSLNQTYLLLTTPFEEKAKKITQKLIEKSEKRKLRIKEIIYEVERRIKNKLSEPIIFEGDFSFPLVLDGSVASALCQKYGKPVFIFKKGKTESCGSVRVPKELNSVDAMSSCAKLLISYGGHPPAAGFRLKNTNLEKFKECLIKYFIKKIK